MRRLVSVRISSARNLVLRYARRFPLRFLMIVAFVVSSFAGVYFVISAGLGFLVSLGGLGAIIIKKLFFILFLILFVMIAISFGVIFYTSALRGRETEFLMMLPLPDAKVSFFKFVEAAFFSSWIPFVGIIIFFLSYVHISKAPFILWVVSPVYVLPFIILSSLTGYTGCIFILMFLRYWRWMLTVLGVFIVYVFIHLARAPSHTGGEIFYFLSREIVFFKVAQCWFMPFSWLSWGIINLENGWVFKSLVFLANMWTLALLGMHIILVKGGPVFRTLFYRFYLRKATYCPSSSGLINKLFYRRRFPDVCLDFFLKDLKIFMREPVLWLQFSIFFGLLFFYFINLRRFSYHLLDPVWKNLIVFLNIFSVLSTGAALSIRFIFPQWSLEGRNYWILKLSPVPLWLVYFEKFVVSFTGLLCVFATLIFISNQMLVVEPLIFNLTLVLTAVSAFTLTGVSLGLGAYFAEFKLENYLKVVESLGGVVGLLVCFGYVAVTVFLFTMLTHLYTIGKLADIRAYLLPVLFLWIAVSATLAVGSTVLGFKRLQVKEY